MENQKRIEYLRKFLQKNVEITDENIHEFCKGKKEPSGLLMDKFKTEEYRELRKSFNEAFQALRKFNQKNIPRKKPSYR